MKNGQSVQVDDSKEVGLITATSRKPGIQIFRVSFASGLERWMLAEGIVAI